MKRSLTWHVVAGILGLALAVSPALADETCNSPYMTKLIKGGEAHHMGFTDDRRFLWAGGLAEAKIHVFDIATDPAKPRLAHTIADMAERTGHLGPHTYYALPGRMLVQALPNLKVLLIDRAGAVREIYTSTFLHLPVVLNDIQTLLMEDAAPRE